MLCGIDLPFIQCYDVDSELRWPLLLILALYYGFS
jgi:hypothetical protein